MTFPIHAITLDLDDTLWPVAPAIERAEAALDAWLHVHAPRTARRWPRDARRVLREEVDAGHPQLAHDFTAQRMLTLERMLASAGDDTALVAPAFEAYFAARCEVVHYDDTLHALERLAARVPLAAVSNGNASLERIGLMHLFAFQLGAREHGAAKPARSLFHAACAQLQCRPEHVLHVGDDVTLDVIGAADAGLRTCWINRCDAHGNVRDWPHPDRQPDLHLQTLAALADWVDALPAHRLRSAA
jgi:FMN hydrolase / 5-amino-6-(5-phospho-D-ribitylamino)uracil phosphatase